MQSYRIISCSFINNAKFFTNKIFISKIISVFLYNKYQSYNDQDMEELIEKIIQKYPFGRKDSLIPILQEIQREAGHLSDTSIQAVGKYMNIPLNKIYGIATFYDQFSFEKKGRYHIQICQGTGCHLKRSSLFLSEIEKTLQVKAGQTTKDGKISLEVVNCLGACCNGPVVSINGTFHGNLTIERLQKQLIKIKGNN